jgi:two-component system sensor histidine kinase BarA
MSYRAFKRLLGETSLERKCRFLFGAAILILITLSFWLYAYQTEHLAYDQAVNSCRLLVNPSLGQHHLRKNLDLAQVKAAFKMIDPGKDYKYNIILENDNGLASFERDLFRDFRKETDERKEHYHRRSAEQVLVYSAPILAAKSCISCHYHKAAAEQDLLGIMQIIMPTKAILDGVHWNRAILMGTALATALLIMAGSWIIVRYIIVKPVKHLKEVSDAISSGELNVRSEIQTGDEFEDLSHAFNRMLRNLVSMQDQWRCTNPIASRAISSPP